MTSSPHPLAVYRQAEFRTNHYLMRPAQKRDQDLMFGWRSHSETSRYLSGTAPESIEDQVAWFEKVSRDTSCSYHIVEEDGVPIGFTSMVNADDTKRDAEWGVIMGTQRGPKAMRVIAPMCCLSAFKLVGLDTLYMCINAQNAGAIRRVEQMGARLYEEPSVYEKRGELLFRIDAGEFLQALPALAQKILSGMHELDVQMRLVDTVAG